MASRLGENNLIEAVCHLDEAGLPHLHVDIILITDDNRLSSKTLITRDFITSVHDALPLILQHHGFDVERGEAINDRKKAGRDAKQNKLDMYKEALDLDKKINDMIKEYNILTDKYNKLLFDSKQLQQDNYLKAMNIIEDRNYLR